MKFKEMSGDGVQATDLKRVGKAEAQRIVTESANLGTVTHKHLESYIEGVERPGGSNQVYQQAKELSDIIINKGFDKLNEVWGIEQGLCFPNLYAGTADMVCVYDGIPVIGDFKTSRKVKKKEWIEDYFLQGCAYANAHNVMFGTKIEQIVILMVDRNAIFQEFIVRPTEFNFLTRKWKNRLIEFNNKYNV